VYMRKDLVCETADFGYWRADFVCERADFVY
jgi:hypothetical protein